MQKYRTQVFVSKKSENKNIIKERNCWQIMKLLRLEKVHDGKYLKNYELTYLNKVGKEKKYEMVSRKEITTKEQLGARPSGVSIVAYQDDKIMLLKEFRMSINKSI